MPSVALEPAGPISDLSHMPFLFRHGNDLALVFAWSRLKPRRVPQYSRSGTTRIWRLKWRTIHPQTRALGPIHDIPTGLEANEVACSACVFADQGEVHLSFIGTAHHGTGTLEHHLFRMSGPNLHQLGPATRVTSGFCGFWRPNLTASGSGKNGMFTLDGAVRGNYSTSFAEIDRLSCDPDHPWRLLITGTLAGESDARTIAYDARQQTVLGELQSGGSPLYKPAICDGVLVYPQPVASPLRETYRLAFTTQFGLVSTPIAVNPV